MGLAMGSSVATSCELQIGVELSQIDDIDVVNLPTESGRILLAGSSGSSVYLHLISLGGVGRDVCLTNVACDKLAISWSSAVLPLKMRSSEENNFSESLAPNSLELMLN